MRHKWTKRSDRLLGRMPDSEVAKRLGVSREAPRRRRIKLGIPAYRPERNWTPEMVQTVNNCNSTTEAAEDLGVSVGAVRVARHRYATDDQVLLKSPK